jgi:hypothetical protein
VRVCSKLKRMGEYFVRDRKPALGSDEVRSKLPVRGAFQELTALERDIILPF